MDSNVHVAHEETPRGRMLRVRQVSPNGALACLLIVSSIVAVVVPIYLIPPKPIALSWEKFSREEDLHWNSLHKCQPADLARIASVTGRGQRANECARDAESHRKEKLDRWQTALQGLGAQESAVYAWHQAVIGAIGTGILFLALGASVWAAWAASLAAKHAKESIDEARRLFAAEHRPWLAIDNVAISGDMTFYQGRTSINIKYKLRNVGSAPVVEFLMYGRVVSNSLQLQLSEIVKAEAAAYSNVKRSGISQLVPARVVFPGQEDHRDQGFIFPASDATIKMGAGLLFSPMVILVGCYRSPFDDETKFTSCVYNVLIDGAALQMPDPNAAIPPIEPTRLRLVPWMTGWTAS